MPPLIEVLALSLGPAIAKNILKIWLKDSSLIEDVSSSFLELFKKRTDDKIAQVKAARQFQVIGERVAEDLKIVFDSEGEKIEENGQTAVAVAVSSILENSPLDPTFLAQRNLDPEQLTNYFLGQSHQYSKGLSAAEVSFLQRILRESSKYIVDIAASLPAFSERTFGEVLRRESEILEIVRNVLAEVAKIRQATQSNNPELEAVAFEDDYRRSIKRKLDRVELFGIDLVRPSSGRHSLSIAYIALNVQSIPQEDAESKKSVRPLADPQQRPLPSPIHDLLAQNSRLLVKGAAGSGKTTLLQWAAVRSASHDFESPLDKWNETVPFFIRLRQYSNAPLPPPEEFVRSSVPTLAETMPRGWVHRQLKSGRALLLIDGVDEVPKKMREKVRVWLQDILGFAHPDTKLIITARPEAVGEGWISEEGFVETELQEMDMPSISLFVRHWHTAVSHETEEQSGRKDIESDSEKFLEEVRKVSGIRALARTPLLCAMLCALNRDRRGRLPRNRIELYSACCDALIHRRDLDRGIPNEDYPALEKSQKMVIAQSVAYWMMRNNKSAASSSEVINQIARVLPLIQNLPSDATAERVLRLFIERTGLLREPVIDSIDFTHRTFEEFLAAQAALDSDDVGYLLTRGTDDQWREVIVLAAGLTQREKEWTALVRGLITRGNKELKHKHQLHLLAIACLETSVTAVVSVKKQIETIIPKLIPPRTMSEARALASTLDLAVPHLKYKASHKATIAAACVRCLSYIGTEQALDTLEGYKVEERQTVIDEILRAWDHFNVNEFGVRIISKLRLESYDADLIDSSGANKLIYLSHVPTVVIRRIDEHKDVSFIQSLRSVKDLWLGAAPTVIDISHVGKLPGLHSLELANFELLSDVSPITSVSNLAELSLLGLHSLEDLSCAIDCAKLKRMVLLYCGKLVGVDRIGIPSSLSSLVIRECSRFAHLNAINSENLSELTLESLKSLRSLYPLQGLENLTTLRISALPGLEGIDPIPSLARITALDSDFDLTDGFRGLGKLPSLTALRVRGCEAVHNLAGLSSLQELRVLELFGCENLSDVRGLSELPKLERIELHGVEKLDDFTPLDKRPTLRSVLVDGRISAHFRPPENMYVRTFPSKPVTRGYSNVSFYTFSDLSPAPLRK